MKKVLFLIVVIFSLAVLNASAQVSGPTNPPTSPFITYACAAIRAEGLGSESLPFPNAVGPFGSSRPIVLELLQLPNTPATVSVAIKIERDTATLVSGSASAKQMSRLGLVAMPNENWVTAIDSFDVYRALTSVEVGEFKNIAPILSLNAPGQVRLKPGRYRVTAEMIPNSPKGGAVDKGFPPCDPIAPVIFYVYNDTKE